MIYLLIITPIYILINIYIAKRFIKWTHLFAQFCKSKWFITAFSVLYTFFAFSPLIAYLLPSSKFERLIHKCSNYWFGIFLYLVLVIIISELIILFFKLSKHVSKGFVASKKTAAYVGLYMMVMVLLIGTFGLINSKIIHTTHYEVTVNKRTTLVDKLNIAMVADLHIGYNIGSDQIATMAEKVNATKPDLVIIAGDIFDNDYDAIDDPESIIRSFQSIKSKYGIYACYGNHDTDESILAGFTVSQKGYKHSDPRMDDLLNRSGIHLLKDESVLINDSFYLVGRRDASKTRTEDGSRKSIGDLTLMLDKSKPIILIDHQPKELQEDSDAGVDIAFSGHTHDGQLFPGNILTSLMWENSCGYLKKNNMHSIVTSGVGVWGPYMRIGTKSEITSTLVSFQ